MKLIPGKPAQSGEARVEREQSALATRRKIERNEQSFGERHRGREEKMLGKAMQPDILKNNQISE